MAAILHICFVVVEQLCARALALFVHQLSRRLHPIDVPRDILHDIHTRTIPEVAGELLATADETIVSIGNRRVLLTRNPLTAKHIFESNSSNYTARMCCEDGARQLGMFDAGIIWNNNESKWEPLRKVFQTSLDQKTLQLALSVTVSQARRIFGECYAGERPLTNVDCGDPNSMRPPSLVDLVHACRKVTFRVTLIVFFGIPLDDTTGFRCPVSACPPQSIGHDVVDDVGHDPTTELSEDDFIEAICAYFKAWEYFLFRSQADFISEDCALAHKRSVRRLCLYVYHLLAYAKDLGVAEGAHTTEDSACRRTFLSSLLQEQDTGRFDQDVIAQCALEMLLAGTDTSSVTAGYAIQAVIDLQAATPTYLPRLRKELHEKKAKSLGEFCASSALDCEEPGVESTSVTLEMWQAALFNAEIAASDSGMLHQLVMETLRFKPVGPVVIRQARDDDVLPASGTKIRKGDGVVIHLALMNRQAVFPDNPDVFDPDRFASKALPAGFYPFGKGCKGCVGEHLGKKEVKAILAVALERFNFTAADHTLSLSSLETRWDIANQPREKVFYTSAAVQPNVVLMGASSTGKTTLCNQLMQHPFFMIRGYRPIQELARTIMQEHGWNRNSFKDECTFFALQQEILVRQNDLETSAADNGIPFLSDRGLDALAYVKKDGTEEQYNALRESAPVRAIVDRYRTTNTVVIMLEPTEACASDDGIRQLESLDDAAAFNKLLESILRSVGIPVFVVPKAVPLELRAKCVQALLNIS